MNQSISRFTIRPESPEPITLERSTPFSFASRRASGEAFILSSVLPLTVAAGLGAGAGVDLATGAASCFAAGAGVAFASAFGAAFSSDFAGASVFGVASSAGAALFEVSVASKSL